MDPALNTSQNQTAPRKLGTVKLYCRCGQKVRITLPAPKPEGRCPKCGHVFVLPQVPFEYQAPAASPAQASAQTQTPTPIPTAQGAPAAVPTGRRESAG
jgi:hypothetical protein